MPWPTGCEWCSFLCQWTEWLRSLNMANRKSVTPLSDEVSPYVIPNNSLWVTLHVFPLYAVSAYKQHHVNGTSCFPPLWSLTGSTCHPINRMKWVAMYFLMEEFTLCAIPGCQCLNLSMSYAGLVCWPTDMAFFLCGKPHETSPHD